MSYKHLDERSVYEERYNRHTVEECRWYEDHFLSLVLIAAINLTH